MSIKFRICWRPGSGSNWRPLAWQASVLSNWTTGTWKELADSNCWPSACKADALPAELNSQNEWLTLKQNSGHCLSHSTLDSGITPKAYPSSLHKNKFLFVWCNWWPHPDLNRELQPWKGRVLTNSTMWPNKRDITSVRFMLLAESTSILYSPFPYAC